VGARTVHRLVARRTRRRHRPGARRDLPRPGRGPSLVLAYARDGKVEPPTLTPESFFPTGDLLVTGEDGTVTVRGREKDVSEATWPEFAFTVDELPQTTVGKLDPSGARSRAHDPHAQLATHPEQHLQGDA
jgi:non-ribosomal peptide synthetase component E (peptide arylation enzyme)